MEEAETLSSRLAIMTKGGKLACQGNTLQIKNEHGKCFHVDLTFSEEDIDEDIDMANVEVIERGDQNPMMTEILGQVVWSREEVINLLETK